MKAQGNALGRRNFTNRSPEGAKQVCSQIGFSAPLQGCELSSPSFPGLRPGLTQRAPLGLKRIYSQPLSKKDFRMRIRISRKESKETRYWLRLLDTQNTAALNSERGKLVQESTELMRIFGAILQNSE